MVSERERKVMRQIYRCIGGQISQIWVALHVMCDVRVEFTDVSGVRLVRSGLLQMCDSVSGNTNHTWVGMREHTSISLNKLEH